MILVDTSVWIDHLRAADQRLSDLLFEEQVVCHQFVVGEIACGTLKRRAEVITLLKNLPHLSPVEHDEALAFVDAHGLAGSGLGWVDLHLLAAAFLASDRIWSRDRPLADAARRLGIAAA